MKKQVLNQVKDFVKECNEQIKIYNEEYIMGVSQFDKDSYVVKIDYTLFYSGDMKKLMKIVLDNGLLMRLGTYNTKNLAYIELQ